MILTWTTQDFVNETVVEYGIDLFDLNAVGFSRIFRDGGAEKRETTIHQVALNNLIPGQAYSKEKNQF